MSCHSSYKDIKKIIDSIGEENLAKLFGELFITKTPESELEEILKDYWGRTIFYKKYF